MIDKLLEQAPGERTMLYLVNAVCFDAKWEKPYEKDDIQKGAVFTAPTAPARRRICCGRRRASICPTTTPPAL